MSTIVTGAGGFAGRWLCAALEADGIAVEAWVHRPTEAAPAQSVRVVDITDPRRVARAVDAACPTRVYHLAAVTNPRVAAADPSWAHAVNVQGTANLFSQLPKTCRGLYVSTCHVHGPPEALPLGATSATNPQGPYAVTKLLGEFEALQHPNTVVARAFHHTGPGQSTDYALADWAAQLRRGARTLSVGDLSVRRDYLDVRDTVAAYRVLAEQASPGSVVPVCSGRSESLATFLAWLIDGDEVDVQVVSGRLRKADVADLVGDPHDLARLGWSPSHPLQQTLRALRRSNDRG